MVNQYHFPVHARHSHRATRISARVKFDGIEVVLPMHARLEEAALLLDKHAAWLLNKWQDLQESHQKKIEQTCNWPLNLTLNAIQATLTIDLVLKNNCYYLILQFSETQWQGFNSEILIGKKLPQASDFLLNVQIWLKDFSYSIFLPKLMETSKLMKLPFDKLRINLAKTCWGSCSVKKTISLNASLLFLEPNLLDYVIIHECAHLKHMNHSKSFWNLVAHYCSNYAMMRNQLKHQAKTLPVWLFQSDCLLIPQL